MSDQQIAEKENFQECYSGFTGTSLQKRKLNKFLFSKTGLTHIWVLTLLLLCAGSMGTVNAGNVHWPPLGAKWWYSLHCLSPQYCGYNLYESKRDTIVSGQAARVIEITRHHVSEVSSAGELILYGDSERVYKYDTINREFFVLYDFSLSVGDTFTIQSEETYRGFPSELKPEEMPPLFRVVVDSTGIAEISGQQLRTLHTSPVTDSQSLEKTTDWEFRGVIIEGIGATGGNPGLSGASSVMMPGGWPGGFRCYEDDEIEYKPGTLDCDYMDANNLNEFEHLHHQVKVYPNPVINNTITIQVPGEYSQHNISVKIYDITGRKVYNNSRTEVNTPIYLQGLNPGIYLIMIKASENIIYKDYLITNH